MGRALALVKENPQFSSDFEISRGVTTLTEAEARAAGVPAGAADTPSAWVRIQREFPEKAPLTVVQYSLSVEAGEASESLALHLRDSREVLQISISDAVKGSAARGGEGGHASGAHPHRALRQGLDCAGPLRRHGSVGLPTPVPDGRGDSAENTGRRWR